LVSDWLVDEPDVVDVVDVPPAVPLLLVAVLTVALLLSEVSVMVKELSRELITETLLLLIKVVPSRGTVVAGTGVSPLVAEPVVPVVAEVVFVAASPLAVDVDDELEVVVVPVDVVVVDVVVVAEADVVPAVVVTEKPGTTLRLEVR